MPAKIPAMSLAIFNPPTFPHGLQYFRTQKWALFSAPFVIPMMGT